MKKILVRFDDICPTMDFQQFQIAMELMDKYDIKPLIGVIPDCQDPDLRIEEPHPDFWDFVRSLRGKGYTIAMHGYVHVFDNHARGMVVSRWDSEFAGHPYEVQLEKIRKGKEILESHGIHTDIFFAPGHSYDRNTLKALSASGFKYMSDGKSAYAYNWYGIKLLPCRSSGAAKIRGNGFFTSVFHPHEWTREEKKYDLNSFFYTINKYKSYIVTFEEYKQQPVLPKWLMRIDEEIFVRWQLYVRPIIRAFYYKFLKK